MATPEQLKFVNTPPKGVTEPYQYPKPKEKGIVTIPSNHLLTPHWHPNADEITTCTQGQGTVTIIQPSPENPAGFGTAITKTYKMTEGESVFLERGYFHYFINTGEEDFIIDLTFDNESFDILTLDKVVSLLPESIKVSAIKSNPDNPVIPFEPVSQEA